MDSKDTSATGRHGPDLSLMRLGREMRRRISPRASLVGALRDASSRMQADAVLLWIPACGLRVAVAAEDRPVPPAMQAEFDQLPQRLASLQESSENTPRIVQGEEADAGCRLIIIAADTGTSRAPAWLVFARSLAAPRFDTWTAVLGQVQAMRFGCRLMQEVDSLTGLLSRAGLQTAIANRRQVPGSLVLAELDGLRTLSHTAGVAGGNAAIVRFARLLAEPLLPEGSMVAHVGAGTFAVAVPEFDAAGAVRIVERIQHALGKIIIEGKGSGTRLSCTSGIVDFDFSADALEQALVAADRVLEMAEERGRARIETRQQDDATMVRRHGEDLAVSDLLESIASGELGLHAQPIISLQDTRHPMGFELLLRSRASMESEEGAYPIKLIEVAQRYQLLSLLDRYVVDQAFTILAPHRDLLARQRVTVSINVCGQSLCDPDFTKHFIDELRHSRIAPACIVVEVIEQVALADLERAGDAMRRLRAAGCGIAIDDFGTGANSLAYVHQLPVTRLKIDGSFIRDITTNKRSEVAVKGIVQLARDFVLQTVGEHVETVEQSEMLRRLGVEFGQGYLFGKAEPLDAAIATLTEREAASASGILNVG